jgi:hypothetical protein
MSISKTFPFLSPLSKLLRFFHRSRDQWKAKCKAAKRENKSLKYCLARMTESRDRWKAEVRALCQSTRKEGAAVERKTKTPAGHGSRPARRRPARPAGVAAR